MSKNSERPELAAPPDPLAQRLFVLYAEGRRLALRAASRFGLTPAQLGVLKALERAGEAGQSDLGERLRMGASTVTGIIDRMERDGLLARSRDGADRRVVKVRLTDRGARLAGRIRFDPMEVLGEAVAGLSPAERHAFARLLDKLATNLARVISR